MSDIMTPISIDGLLDWILMEKKNSGTVFGVRKFFKADKNKTLELFGEKMETPIGPAAGPHSQLTQNIVASYISGSRFFEVKTVQILDGEDLPVEKPCIDARDECYNCEWSTELRVPQAFEEYAKGWFILKLLSKEYGLGDPNGFIFNMSVGYDLAGIQSPKVDKYITEMKDASKTDIWAECVRAAKERINEFENIDEAYIDSISAEICRSITLSTLHGCPPDEIEKIASYFINEKGLNTFVKCNPTLLEFEEARAIMDDMGYEYMAFGDTHFKGDLDYEDAVPMFKRLGKEAEAKGLNFGVKITNTFPVDNTDDVLPAESMYMSGRSLLPLSITIAKKLSDDFDGKLQISYSGGMDYYNVNDLLSVGIWPITLATTLLKPGGYQRCYQIASEVTEVTYPTEVKVDCDAVTKLMVAARHDEHYTKPIKPIPNIKMKQEVPLTNCYVAPCNDGCPISQDIPAYLKLVDEGKHLEALNVIVDKNPLPFMTGTICAHPCMSQCTRKFYDNSVHIRSVKLEAAEHAYDEFISTLNKPEPKHNATKTAVIGGGPAGISAAFLLAREGMPVTVFEKYDTLGGVCAHIVPEFRISMESVQKDVNMARRLGAEFVVGKPAPSLEELRAQGYTNVIYAIGAWKHGQLRLEKGETINALQFLEANRKNLNENPYGEDIVVVGGGNTAMDTARAAKRLPNVKNVSLVYRRDRRNMPADAEELDFALEDGIDFLELLAPIKLENGMLTCEIMKLGARDKSGRRSPEGTGQFKDVKADCVIAAVGEKVNTEFFAEQGLETTERGRVIVNPSTLESSVKDVYVIGDANRGPAKIVEAIADATTAAKNIVEIHNQHFIEANINPDVDSVRAKRGILIRPESTRNQAGRCLECSSICESCMDVCPNRANVVVVAEAKPQIVHVDRMCNECGNCETFCPYSSAPYKDKFTLFNTVADFNDSTNSGFCLLDSQAKKVLVRIHGHEKTVSLLENPELLPRDLVEVIEAVINDYAYMMLA